MTNLKCEIMQRNWESPISKLSFQKVTQTYQKSREISKIFQKLLMRGCAGINILEKLCVFTTHIYQQMNHKTPGKTYENLKNSSVINPFMILISFYNPWNIGKPPVFCFQGYRKRPGSWKWLTLNSLILYGNNKDILAIRDSIRRLSFLLQLP